MVWFLVTLWDNFGSIGVVWFFVECQFQDCGLIWCMGLDGLDFFWKPMKLGIFCMVQSTQERHGTIFVCSW